MKRILALAVSGLAMLAPSACSSTSSRPAATVNGVDLPTSALLDELNAIGANNDYLNTLNGNVRGTTPGSFDAAFVAQVLLQEINFEMVRAEFAHRNLQTNDACRQQARNDVFLDIGNQNANTGETLFNKFDKKYQDVLLKRREELLALTYDAAGQHCGQPVDGASYYRTHPDDFTKVCIQAIAVADKTTADSVVAQARGGGDFQALARDVSLDDQSKANGGDIGCSLPSTFNPSVSVALKTAKVGDVLDPFVLQNGYGIFRIYDRQPLSSDEAQQQAEELATLAVDRNIDLGSWIAAARASAKVTIDPRYGTFDPPTFTIKPPAIDSTASSDTTPTSSSGNP